MPATTVHTSEFENSHGRAPKGRGGWLFFFEGTEEPLNFNGTFTQARRQAVAEAKRQGVENISVAP
jgi:hypothetical protein